MFPESHKTRHVVSTTQSLPTRAKTTRYLISTGGGYHLGTSEYPRPAPHPFLLSAPLSPICPVGHTTSMNINLYAYIQDILLVHKREVLHASGTYHSSSTDDYQLNIAHLVTKSNTSITRVRVEGYYHATYHITIQDSTCSAQSTHA
jgi:hypothetical protein